MNKRYIHYSNINFDQNPGSRSYKIFPRINIVFSVPIPSHKLRFSHVNIFYAIMEDN